MKRKKKGKCRNVYIKLNSFGDTHDEKMCVCVSIFKIKTIT